MSTDPLLRDWNAQTNCYFDMLLDYELFKCKRDRLLPLLKTFFVLCSKRSSELKAFLNNICQSSQLSGLRIVKTEMQPSSVFQGILKKMQTCLGFKCVCYLTQKITTVKQYTKAIICHPTQMLVFILAVSPVQPIIVYTRKHESFLFLPQNSVNERISTSLLAKSCEGIWDGLNRYRTARDHQPLLLMKDIRKK